ncbi:MAG: RHS repeat-associated core domain-containing protein [Saccharofermentanales bacterium]
MTALPYRYRGYRYDVETGLYYVTSRYYDPNIGRFLNADDTDVMIEHLSDSLISTNLYTYCLNNPVNIFDNNEDYALEIVRTTSVIFCTTYGDNWKPASSSR